MVKALIIEDEIEARQALIKLLGHIAPEITIVGQTASIADSVAFLKENEIDIALVDIELEDGNSFKIFDQLVSINFRVIFTTAFSSYAIKAFKVNAMDYLLKPIDPQELKEAVEKAISQVDAEKTLQKLIDISQEKEAQKIILNTTRERHVVKVADIIRVEAQGAYTNFTIGPKSILVSKNLRYYETLFEEYQFLRPHNSHLVNATHVAKMQADVMVMSNGDQVPISTRRRSAIRKALTTL